MTEQESPQKSDETKPAGESNWHMRLAVISTIATVLALVVPFMVPSGQKPDSSESREKQEKESRALPDPKNVVDDVKKDLENLKDDIKKDFGPPNLPFPKK